MANSFLLTGGPVDIQLQYNAASQTDYRMLYGARLQVPEPAVMLHMPDGAPSAPVRAHDLDRTFFFEVNAQVGSNNSDWDPAIDALAEVKRLVDGANSQALRYHLRGDVDRVALRVQLDSSDNYTDQVVHWGYVDDGASFYGSVATIHKQARQAVVALTFTPYGEGAAISLHNDLANPAFLFEGSTSGLAASWTLQLSPTVSLDADIWLIGGQSQKVVTNAVSDQGIQSSAVTVSASTSLNAYIWIYHAGGDDVTVELLDGSSVVVDTATVTAANPGAAADKSAVDGAGNTWYRIPLSGTNTNANASILVSREINDATQATTFYLDGAYLDATSNTTTVPAAWMSSSAIKNRNDQTTGNPERINYYDVWGIPGDAPALVRHQIQSSHSGGRSYIVASGVRDGRWLAAQQRHWLESDEFDGSLGTTNASWSTGTGTSDNHYHRLTAAGGTGSGSRRVQVSGDTLFGIFAVPRRVFMGVRSSDTGALFTVTTSEGSGLYDTTTANVQAANTWELVEVGRFNAGTLYEDTFGASSPTTLNIVVAISNLATGETADIDFVWLPWLDQYLIAEDAVGAAGGTTYLDGIDTEQVVKNPGTLEPTLGSLWEAVPGQVSNRYTITTLSSAFAHTIADTYTVSVTLVPRTRHLLGAT